MEPLIITAAITGAELTKEQCPTLPVTPEEQAKASQECVEAGASIIHLHVRNKNGKPSQSLDDFKASIDAIRATCDPVPIIQISTGGAVGDSIEQRIAPLALKPDMASFNCGSINFGDDLFANTFPDMRSLAEAFSKFQVIPEYEIYDLGHLSNLQLLGKQSPHITPPFHIQFVLGVPGALQGDAVNDLAPLIQQLPSDSHWSVAGIGRHELPLSTIAIATGGHVRVGLEDNIYYRKGELATSNAQLVKRVVRIAKECERPVASITKAREQLGVSL